MNVLVLGSGGREHALCWKISQSSEVDKVYCAPGNAGISNNAECVDISVTEFEKLIDFAIKNNVDLTVVGPEVPLALGIVDEFEKNGLLIFGPSKAAAKIEGSKSFSKDLMKKYSIPSAEYKKFNNIDEAKNYIRDLQTPFVIKADGLAAGKGVIICNSIEEGDNALNLIMDKKEFGDAGRSVVIEDFLKGEEASFFAFTDGINLIPLEPSQDHKAIYDGDKGPNTGGMGAYTPAPIISTDELKSKIINEVMLPIIRGLAQEGRPYKGILYAGLMIDGDVINVLEFNCRFGDPEAQPLLMRMDSDIVPILYQIAKGKLEQKEIKWKDGATVCVVLASEGYPGKYNKGITIEGLDNLNESEDLVVFHAGTKYENGNIVTNGGRVLGITAYGSTISKAISKAYKGVNMLKDNHLYFRNDIGMKAVKR